jgi:hypothetical protein
MAGIAALEGKVDQARKLLEGAIVDAEVCGMITLAALARRRLGQLEGGEAGARMIADADHVLGTRGVVDPARFARIFSTWPD